MASILEDMEVSVLSKHLTFKQSVQDFLRAELIRIGLTG